MPEKKLGNSIHDEIALIFKNFKNKKKIFDLSGKVTVLTDKFMMFANTEETRQAFFLITLNGTSLQKKFLYFLRLNNFFG